MELHWIAAALVAPTQPWDALICTSPAVRQAMERMFEEYGDYLGERTRGIRPPQPALPVVPLGVDGEAVAKVHPALARLHQALESYTQELKQTPR